MPIDGGGGEMMYRGVFWSSSEVGAARFRGTMFLYDTVCDNHIVWGAKVIAEISIRHTGEARREFSQAMATITDRIGESAAKDEQRILQAKRWELAPTKEKLISLVFGKQLGLTRTECEQAYALADRYSEDHGDNPRSAWGYAAGVTRLSQGAYMDQRDRLDRAAGRILDICF